MKRINKNAYLLSLLGTLLLAACGKEGEAAKPAAETESSDPVAAVAAQVEDAADSVKEMAEPAKEVVETVQAEMKEAKEAVTASVSEASEEGKDVMQVVQNVKELIGQAKYPEALAAISELSIDQLSPELQKVAQGLKEQAEKALSEAAASKAGEGIEKVLKENNITIENPFKK